MTNLLSAEQWTRAIPFHQDPGEIGESVMLSSNSEFLCCSFGAWWHCPRVLDNSLVRPTKATDTYGLGK